MRRWAAVGLRFTIWPTKKDRLSPALAAALKGQTVMRAPRLGRAAEVNGSKLKALVRGAKLPKDVTVLIPPLVSVERRTKLLTAAELTGIYREALIRHLGPRAKKRRHLQRFRGPGPKAPRRQDLDPTCALSPAAPAAGCRPTSRSWWTASAWPRSGWWARLTSTPTWWWPPAPWAGGR